MGWVAIAFDVFDEAWARWRKFRRKKTAREELEILATYDNAHAMLSSGRCAVCGRRSVLVDEKCPGPKAVQRARAKLEKLKQKEK